MCDEDVEIDEQKYGYKWCFDTYGKDSFLGRSRYYHHVHSTSLNFLSLEPLGSEHTAAPHGSVEKSTEPVRDVGCTAGRRGTAVRRAS
jgi:hypothetical protein